MACSLNAKSTKKPVVIEKKPVELAVEAANEGRILYEQNDYAASLIKYNSALELFNQALPNSVETDSIPAQILKINSNIAKIHSDYTLSLSSQNDFDMAIEEYESSLDIYQKILPESTPADSIDHIITNLYKFLAICNKQSGEFDKAISYYEMYLDRNPEDVEVLNTIYRIYKDDLKNDELALNNLKDYAELKQDFGATHRVGDLYKDRNDIDNAILWYEKALLIKKDSNILQKLGTLYRNPSKQMWDKSNQVLEQFVLLNPSQDDLITAYKLIGDNYKNLKNKPKAIEFFEKYLDLEYNEEIATYVCGYYYEIKNNPKTISWANTILQNNPSNSTAILFRGIARYNMKDMKGAKADFERIKNDPKHGKAASQYLNVIK